MRKHSLIPTFASAVALFSALVLQSTAVDAQGVTIELMDANVNPGGMTSIDVTISPTNGPQTLNAFEVPFLISASEPGQLSSLQFADPHDEFFLTDPASDYLFFGNSDAVNLGAAVNDTQSVNMGVNNYLFAFDLTFNLDDMTLTEPRLLTQLQFTHIVPPGTGPLAVIGESFSVAIDDTFDPVAVDNLNADFIDVTVSGPATVTVVPEPGTFALCAALSGCIALRRRRR
tara:strand:+ start:199993 stop:200682 length:690 start_codon:yes stop_codon:yes gene_type:complete